VIPASVRYARAADVDDALTLLAEPEAKPLAGGQSLVPVMKLRIARPSLVVDISRLELRGVHIHDGELHLGALTTWDDLLRVEELRRPALSAIAECALGIGDLQVRNRGTVGGSLVHADPASDIPAVLLALGAAVTLRSPDGDRVVPLADFLVGPFTTALGTQELVSEVVVPLPEQGSGSAYVSLEHPASGFAVAGAAALVGPSGTPTVAVTGLAGNAFVLPERVDPAAALASTDVFGDRFASAEYRRGLTAVLVARALERAAERAEEDR
jgi:carbon-monoxide dehydrogenase medium subunit